jgi:hypothetical protein
MLNQNQAGWDRAARIALGVALLALAWAGAVTGVVGTASIVIGVIALLTGAVGWCPLYSVLGFSTRGGFHRTRTA